MAQAPLHIQLVHQFFKGRILVFVRVQGGLFHQVQQGGKRGIAAQVRPQRQGVYEKSD